jgi:glycerol-3-phosphate cytidylyltransferase|tara:strand:+ start:197 stop:667 length:471 start_codon:yes stop_codon:yes gene_type:complete
MNGNIMSKEIVGITASTFDLLHAGHILMLREAKSVCDHLIVALQLDPSVDRPEKNKPVQTYMERYIQLSAVKYVDEIVPYATEKEFLALLRHLPVDIRIIGEDYYDKDFTGKEDVPVHYNKRQHDFSTSGLRTKVATRSWPDEETLYYREKGVRYV